MKHNDDEKKIEILIGEAVLSLLQENGPVNSAALVERLEQMAAGRDSFCQFLIRQAIAEVREGISTARNRSHMDTAANDAHRHISGSDSMPQGSKKH